MRVNSFYSDGVHVDDPLAPPHTPPGTGGLSQTTNLYHSKSNPDLTSLYCYDDLRAPDYPEHVLKVYKADQTCKYLLIHKETTAHEVDILISGKQYACLNVSICMLIHRFRW